jgi:pimeloyl-ACP methyl ester carboxylesterase
MSTLKEEPLVLVHGYPFDHKLWFGVVAALGAGAKAILPDLPGFGHQPVLETEPSMDGYADYLRDFADRHGAEKIMLAGMSMGGYAALAFAEKYPERVSGLGLISTQAAADTEETRRNRMALIHRIDSEGPDVAAQALMPKMFSEASAGKPDLTRFVSEGARAAGSAGLAWALRAMAGRPNRTAFLKSLRIPVAVAHGAADKIIPLAQARGLAEQCQNPIFIEIKDAGHATPLEAPDAVAGLLARLVLKVRQNRPEQEPEAAGASAHS